MKKIIAQNLIRFALWFLPLTEKSHEAVEVIMNPWVDKLNKACWKHLVKETF